MSMRPPSLQDVERQLKDLLAGRQTRAQVSAWASRWLTAETMGVDDPLVRQSLVRLGAAELKESPEEFLYSEKDFHLWLDEIEAASEGKG